MKIVVTIEDIKAGRPNDCRWCPVAYAFKKKFRGNTVEVNGSYALIGCHIILLPSEVSQFIYKYDRHEHVYPFTFEIEEPPAKMDNK